MITTILTVSSYILILFILSILAIRKALNSYDEYSYCGKALPIAYVVITYFGTWVGGGTIVGLVSRSYQFGASQYWLIGLSCIAELFFALFMIRSIRKLEVKTIAGFFLKQYNDRSGILGIPVTCGLLIRNVTVVAMQFGALSYLITFVFGIDRNLALLIIFLVITAYTVLSGLWGVVMTDAFQGFLQTAGIICLIVTSLKMVGGISKVQEYYISNASADNLNLFKTSMSPGEIILYIVAFGLFFLMNDQANWERIYASKNDKVAKWGFIIPIVITMIMLVFITYLGIIQKVVFGGQGDPGSIIYDYAFTFMNSKLAILVLVGLIAAIMSSADSVLLASGTMISEDIIRRFIFKSASDKEMIYWTRVFIVIAGAVSFAFTLAVSDILSLWFAGIGLTSIVLVPGYLLGWLGVKPSSKYVLYGMICGLLIVAIMFIKINCITPANICIGMLINFAICLVGYAHRDKDRI